MDGNIVLGKMATINCSVSAIQGTPNVKKRENNERMG
jgi:hypothetical protein